MDLLYVHPHGHLNDLVVPAGALTSVNAFAGSKLGRYAFELDDDEILEARVVAADLHWALGVSGFAPLVRHVRALRPEVPIVVGGVTAGHLARELLDARLADFVLVGDSEVGFAALVEALVAGRATAGLPNVHARGEAPVARRMTEAEFDVTDCLTADWFPTYDAVSRLDAAAFPAGRTLPVARGCPLRCPDCYGSYASTYGAGYLVRSPAGVVGLLRRAAAMELANLRLFLGKLPAPRLDALIDAIAAAGPFPFDSMLGLFLCTPPSPEQCARLEAAFPGEVAFSMVPPAEHVPALPDATRAHEEGAWRTLAAHVRASSRAHLDAWTTARGSAERARALFAP